MRQGRVLHVGISDTPAWIVAQANTLASLRGWTPFVALQLRYSLIDRSAEAGRTPARVVIRYAGRANPRAL